MNGPGTVLTVAAAAPVSHVEGTVEFKANAQASKLVAEPRGDPATAGAASDQPGYGGQRSHSPGRAG